MIGAHFAHALRRLPAAGAIGLARDVRVDALLLEQGLVLVHIVRAVAEETLALFVERRLEVIQLIGGIIQFLRRSGELRRHTAAEEASGGW